ncbi:MAG: DUF3944 domain-containing protein [Bacteroides sp.]|nr:DUF3944 domain-containing protein [Bacteroides sp.]
MEELDFLNQASNEELKVLCDIIVKDKKGNFRLTEELSVTKIFKECYPDNIKGMLPQLVEELRKFGGNTLTTMIQGHGPTYSKILRKVAKKSKVNFNQNANNELIEQYLLQKLFTDSLDKASDEQLKEMMQELGLPTTNFGRQAAVAALMLAWKGGGFKSYILLVSVVNGVLKFLIGRGLPLVANAALTRTAAILTGPIGWALTTLWTVADIAGPAYRVIIPAVIQIAYIRQNINNPITDPTLLLN